MSGLFTFLQRLGRDGSGAIAALFAILIPLLVATIGLGVETGIWYSVKSL